MSFRINSRIEYEKYAKIKKGKNGSKKRGRILLAYFLKLEQRVAFFAGNAFRGIFALIAIRRTSRAIIVRIFEVPRILALATSTGVNCEVFFAFDAIHWSSRALIAIVIAFQRACYASATIQSESCIAFGTLSFRSARITIRRTSLAQMCARI